MPKETMTNKQKPREDGWYYRSDGAYPYQNWCPFDDPDAQVEVKNSTTGLSRVDFVKNVWWGYTGGLESETVINYARIAEPLKLDTPGLDWELCASPKEPDSKEWADRANKYVQEVTSDPDRLAKTLARVDIAPAEALNRHTAVRRGVMEALRELDHPETEVFIEVYHKSSSQRLKVPASVKDQARRLLVAIESESRENFIKEYVDV